MQCDKCELWFHMICIGVAEDEIDENEDYICFQCRNPRAARHVTSPPPSSLRLRSHVIALSLQSWF